MPTRRDNDEERFARIQALIEKYRLTHEDLLAYVEATQKRVARSRKPSPSAIEAARDPRIPPRKK